MSCTTWNDSLTGRLYDEIGAEDDAALSAHLATCAACRETLDAFRRVRTLLREEEPDIPRAPRVLVLQGRHRFRPMALAASLLGAAILAGAGYALGSGRAPAPVPVPVPVAAANPAEPGVSTEELVRREVDRRMASLQLAQMPAVGTKATAPVGTPKGERPITSPELRSELAKFERRLNGARAADLDYVLDQIAASEVRIGARLGQTNQALRTVALASNPRVDEQ